MRVADDEPDPDEPPSGQRTEERQPVRALVAAGGGDLDPEHRALAGRADPDRDEGRHRHDPATLTDLMVEGIERDIGIAGRVEQARAEGVDFGVEPGADPGHLALGQVGHAQRDHELLDPARADAADVCLLHDRQQRPFGAPARLEQAREVGPVAELGDLQVDRPDPRIPTPLAVAVALGQSAVRCTFAMVGPDLGAHLGVHHQLAQHRQALTQEVEVAVTGGLAQQFQGGHPVIGHRVHLFRRRFLTPTS